MVEQSVGELELLLEQAKRGTENPLYVCLRSCYVGDRLWKKGHTCDLPASVVKDPEFPQNFRPLGITAELHEQATEDDLNEAHEAKIKVKDKPDHIPPGWYWCTECQRTHNGNANKRGKVNKIAKLHLKYRALEEVTA